MPQAVFFSLKNLSKVGFPTASQLRERATAGKAFAGQAVQLLPDGLMGSLPANASRFPDRLTREILIFKDEFRHEAGPITKQHPSSGKGPWIVTKGQPRFDGDTLQGGIGDMELYGQLNAPRLGPDHPVLLVTLQTGHSRSFHSLGYAGLSFFRGNEEIFFFGDCHGDQDSWGVDVRHHGKPRHPETNVTGPRSVTLSYDFNSGELNLYHGLQAQGKAFLETQLRPGLELDRIRLAQGKGGELNVDQLLIRILSAK